MSTDLSSFVSPAAAKAAVTEPSEPPLAARKQGHRHRKKPERRGRPSPARPRKTVLKLC